MAMTAAALEAELQAARYQPGGSARPGQYRRADGRFDIHTRRFRDPAGAWPERQLRVHIAGGRVASITDVAGRALAEARIDPARIATFYGPRQREQRPLRLAEMPPLLVTGVQAVEDRDFKHPHGVDASAILRAAWRISPPTAPRAARPSPSSWCATCS